MEPVNKWTYIGGEGGGGLNVIEKGPQSVERFIYLSIVLLSPPPPSHISLTRNPLRWFYIILVLFVIRLAAGNVFASTALFINNSVVFGKLGEVNGLAHSLTALLR